MEAAANDEPSDEEGGEAAAMGRGQEGAADGKYVPPKLTAVHYDGDESRQERERKKQERAKKRALGLSIIHDLKEEFLDNPTEISGSSRAQQILSSTQREKEEYEETYLTRLPITKAEKIRARKLTTMGEWDEFQSSYCDPLKWFIRRYIGRRDDAVRGRRQGQ